MLFVLSLEPWAILVRKNDNIKGIKALITEMKGSLFADDILLTVADPPTSLKYIFDTVNEFGAISGYTIN